MSLALAPRKDFLSRRSSRVSNASSVHGSKSSSTIFASAISQRKSSSRSLNASQFSMRRSSLQNVSARSSTNSLRRQKSSRQNSLANYIQEEEHSKQNAVWTHTEEPSGNALWNVVNQGLGSQGSPSLISSEGSVLSEDSSQSSLQSPDDDAEHDFMNKYALHKASMQQQTNTPPGSPGNHAVGRTSMQHPIILHSINSLQGSRRNSFHVHAQIKDEDVWGQFVETANAEEQLVCRSQVLSIARRYPASFSNLNPAQ